MLKTFTPEQRYGNAEPRWYPASFREAWESGDKIFLNSVGLTNPGIYEGAEWCRTRFSDMGTTVIASIAGDSTREWTRMASVFNEIDSVKAIELNLSCPNWHDSCVYGASEWLTDEAVSAARECSTKPLIAKLAPNVPDIAPIAKAAIDSGADALTICNTIPANRIDISTGKSVLGHGYGGLSGESLRPIALSLVENASRAVNAPIIGCGGVFTYNDVLEYFCAGAIAVQIGSANLVNINTPWMILESLISNCEEYA